MQRFLRKLSRRRNLDRELEAELAFHREMAEAAGNSIPLGNALLIRERSADPWRFTLIESIWRDVVYGIRGLRRSPTLVLIAVIATALGVGSTTAVFSLVDAVLLKPAPVPDPDRFVMLPVSVPAKFAQLRAQTSVLENVSAYMPGTMNFTGGDASEQVQSMQISSDAFRCWGTPILEGRGFTMEEDAPGGAHVAVIGEEFWQRRYAGDPSVLGQTIALNGDVYTIIGVAATIPLLLEQGAPADVYVPFQLDLNSSDGTLRFRAMARLKSGVSLEQANARLRVAAAEFWTRFPNSLAPRDNFPAVPYRDAEAGGNRPLLMILLGAVALVLLIACANVAGLLLVRAESRRREIAIRAAIGAGRGRVIRQLITESLLLSIAGGAVGLLLGFAGIRALLAVNTAGLPRLGENGASVALDWRVMVFALALSLVTGIVFGLFPAIEGSRADVNSILKDGGRSGFKSNKIRSALVVGEVGIAVTLLIGTALLIRTFVALYSVDTGFDTRNVATMRMKMTGSQFQNAAAVSNTMRAGLERIRALPGIESATATYFIPLQTAIAASFNIAGQPALPKPSIGWVPISTGYFDVFKIPLKRGRVFNERDDAASPPVVVINQSMARQYWNGADPLKDRILIGQGRGQFAGDPARQIIGVVGDVVDTQLRNRDPRPTMYVPQAQITNGMNAFLVRIQPVAWIVRSRTDPRTLIPSIREQLRQATGLPVAEVRSMDQVESRSIAGQRFNMLLMSVFGGTALLLAAIGIYGLMAYAVEQRGREIGIRLALGAEAGRVWKAVVFEGIRLALLGAGIGLALAFDLTHFLASFLFGVQARDPIVFLAVPIVLSAVALLAVWIPARRASKIDPIKALRYE